MEREWSAQLQRPTPTDDADVDADSFPSGYRQRHLIAALALFDPRHALELAARLPDPLRASTRAEIALALLLAQ